LSPFMANHYHLRVIGPIYHFISHRIALDRLLYKGG